MIRLTKSQIAHIRTLAERAYPEECCGLLVGRRTREDEVIVVSRIVESPNIHTERARDRFEVDPKVRLDLERSLRGTAERVVGHYHSHPDHPALPSDTDRAMAFEPELMWVIIAVAEGRAADVRAFKLQGNEFAAVEIGH